MFEKKFHTQISEKAFKPFNEGKYIKAKYGLW